MVEESMAEGCANGRMNGVNSNNNNKVPTFAQVNSKEYNSNNNNITWTITTTNKNKYNKKINLTFSMIINTNP